MESRATTAVLGASQVIPGSDYALSAEGVRKVFPGVIALDEVSFRLRRGTVHALIGENGAGKSTLMKILAGIYLPDKGTIKINDVVVRLKSPLDALENGIAMIHQELNLMPYMTVAENIWIRREPKNRFGLVDHREMRRKTKELLSRLKIDINPEIEICKLSVASRQMVEIAKAVSYQSNILIMDEPTSALTEREVHHLFEIIKELRAAGISIIYITHRMNELFEIADEFSVFRDGKHVATRASTDVTRDDIIRMMVGREITQLFPKEEVPIGDTLLSVVNLSLKGIFEDVSFEVRAGEILGVAGLVGSGRSNVAEALFGVTPASSGTIEIGGTQATIDSPAAAIRNRMAFLTEDRKNTGCFLILNILENMLVAVLQTRFVTCGFVREKQAYTACLEMSRKLRLKAPNLDEKIENLSGGNQQKALIGRWLLTEPRILILDEPTRGIDVGAKAEIYRLVSELARNGVAILMISSELQEVLGMSDRIMVMQEGRIAGFLDRAEASQIRIMELAAR